MDLQRIRLKRAVTSLVVVYPFLEAGDVIAVPDERAQQYISSGMAEALGDDEPAEIEAAALRSPRRRG